MRLAVCACSQACFGHTEGAAGLTGVFLAVGALRNRGAPGVMCLRELNPYVAAALADWRRRSNCAPLLPRATTMLSTPSLAGLFPTCNAACLIDISCMNPPPGKINSEQ